MKKLTIVVAVVLGLVLVVALGVWFFFDVNQFRPLLERALSDAIGRSVKVRTLKVALLDGGVSLEGLTVADDPAFSAEPFLTARSVSAGVELRPLIFSRSLRVQSFTIEKPRVVLRRSRTGVWNITSLGSSSRNGASRAGGSTMSLLVKRLAIADGEVVVVNGGRSQAYSDVDLTLSDLSLTAPFAFEASAKLPGGGKATLAGNAGPLNTSEVVSTPFQGKVDVARLDVGSTGFVDAQSGLKGLVDLAGTLTSNGTVFASKGKITATKLQIVPDGAPSRVAAGVDYDATYSSRTQRGEVKRGDVRVGAAAARLTGDYTTRGATPQVTMRLVGEKMPIVELEGALPAIGATLPAGASLRQGTMDANLTIEGPLDRLVINGPMTIAKGTLADFDLGGKLGAIASFAGLPKGKDTILESLGATLRVGPEGIAVQSLQMVVPAIGTLTGSGTIAPNDAMDFRMLAKLKEGAGPAGMSGNIARAVAFSQSAGIPFRITGTTANPSFAPDLGAMTSSAKSQVVDTAKNPDALKKAAEQIGGLFNRNKK